MDISKSSQALGAPDVRAGDNVYCDVIIICTTTDSGGTNPFSCLEHIKRPLSPRTALEPCRARGAEGVPASLDAS